jgi:tRNA A37 threonylcarbamoyladenosine dehydratase
MEQFLRTRLLLGEEKFTQLQKSCVTIVGVGAVGSYATEALARVGVGKLRLVDCDKVKLSNLNRQLIALYSTLDRPKAVVAKERVKDINPACAVEALEVFADQENFAAILDNRPDLVVDCIDAVNPKVHLLKYCVQNGIPVVSSMGAALRSDPLSLKVGDISKTHSCPLAERVRRQLRKEGVKKGVLCVYSAQAVEARVFDPGEFPEEGGFTRGRQRRILGSLPTITGMFGLVLAHQAIELLTKKAEK